MTMKILPIPCCEATVYFFLLPKICPHKAKQIDSNCTSEKCTKYLT